MLFYCTLQGFRLLCQLYPTKGYFYKRIGQISDQFLFYTVDLPKVSFADKTSLTLSACQLSFALRLILLISIPLISSDLSMYKHMFVCMALYPHVFGELFTNRTPGHEICISTARENRFSKGIASLTATVRYYHKHAHMLICTYAPHSIFSLSKHWDRVTSVLDSLRANIFWLPVDHPKHSTTTLVPICFQTCMYVCIW